jgi:hypothetical protein
MKANILDPLRPRPTVPKYEAQNILTNSLTASEKILQIPLLLYDLCMSDVSIVRVS